MVEVDKIKHYLRYTSPPPSSLSEPNESESESEPEPEFEPPDKFSNNLCAEEYARLKKP